MSEPRVVTVPFGGSPLAHAAVAGELPPEWYARAPRAGEWESAVRATAGAQGAGDWHAELGQAFAASGAAAERLARSAQGRGAVVTTGQQPGLFGGPVYTWSKALSALALADALERTTGLPVAPVFWAATYDADFTESSASYVILNGDLKHLQMPLPAVPDREMRDTPLGDVGALRASVEQASGSAVARTALDALRDAYAAGETIGSAYVKLLRAILETLGIAVLDAGHPSVRAFSAPLLRRALDRAGDIDAAITTRENELRQRGYEPPVAHVAGLSTVFEYRNGSRVRIPITDAAHVDAHAELEPNVLLRPLVERAILPTVAYLGGPGEVAYFAQATAIAHAMDEALPIVLPRWSGMIIEPHVQRLLERHSLEPADLRDPHAAERRRARSDLSAGVRDAIAAYKAGADALNDELRSALAHEHSTPLVPGPVLDGVRHSIAHRLERLERRVLAAAKRRDASTMRDIAIARASLYPLGKPQERVLNFIPMLARHGAPLVDAMRAGADAHADALTSGAAIGAAEEPLTAPR